MKKIRYFASTTLAGLCMLLSTSCINTDSDEKHKCGSQNKWDGYPYNNLTNNALDAVLNERYLYYEDISTPSDICPEHAVFVHFRVNNFNGMPFLTSVQGKAYWGLNEQQLITLEADGSGEFHYGELSCNLKPFFGELPGWIGATVIVKFPTQGSIDVDKQYIKSHIQSMSTEIDYYQY